MHAVPRGQRKAPPHGRGPSRRKGASRHRGRGRTRDDDDRDVDLRARDDRPGRPAPRLAALPRGVRGPRAGTVPHGMVRNVTLTPVPEDLVRVSIDGRAATVPRGSTVLTVAAGLGIEIPTLCYDPRLPVTGSCRMCMVEEDGAKNLVPACAREVREGQVVQTGSDRVARARRVMIELLLAAHPLPCAKASLDPDGCELERHARTYGVAATRFPRTGDFPEADGSNPAIVFDASACIN